MSDEKQIILEDVQDITGRSYIPYEKLTNKTVLITGANGMLASCCVHALMYLNSSRSMNINVYALVRNAQKARDKFCDYLDDEHFHILVQDVCQPIENIPSVQYIIHAAGGASPKYIKGDPVGICRANTIGTFNVMELARRFNSRVLYTSTREVYGANAGQDSVSENDMGVIDPMDTRSCYPESKRMSEQIIKSYQTQYDVDSVIVRIAHSYGPGMDIDSDGRVMSDFISDAVNGRDIVLKSDGTAVRAFCYVNDAAAAMFAVMLMGGKGECYNVANETEPIMIRDAAKMLAKAFPEREISVSYCQSESDKGLYCAYKRVGLDTGKLEQLGWRPEVNLEKGLRRTVLSFGDEKWKK